jgi:NitT/TauT family transport system substrate-binding protein
MLQLRPRILLPVLLGLLCAGTAAQAQNRVLEQPAVRMAVGGKVGLFYLPVTIAERLGYFKDEGLQVEFIDLGSGGKALQALVGGSADVTSGSYEHTIQMQAKGVDLQAFVLQGSLVDYSLGIVKAKAASYKSPKDLKGMRVGVSSPGSGTNFFLNAILAKAGLKPNDVVVVGIGQTAGAIAAMRNGELDAVSNTDPVMTKLELAGDVVIVADARTREGSKAVYGGSYMAGALYAKTDFIKRNPNTVQAMTTAMVRALRWLAKASPEQVVTVLPPEFQGGDRKDLLAALVKVMPTYSADGKFNAADAEVVRAALASFDPAIKNARIDVSKTYDNGFVMKVPAK